MKTFTSLAILAMFAVASPAAFAQTSSDQQAPAATDQPATTESGTTATDQPATTESGSATTDQNVTTDENAATTDQNAASDEPAAADTDAATTTEAAPSSSTNIADAGFYTMQTGDLRASRLIGMSVRNAADEAIGDINEVVLSKDGKVAAVIVGVGGFLGMGEREVAIPFSSLKMAASEDGANVVSVDLSRDALAAAPAWTWPE
jgi:sporulation protein YlmC with PRC-barrel domain